MHVKLCFFQSLIKQFFLAKNPMFHWLRQLKSTFSLLNSSFSLLKIAIFQRTRHLCLSISHCVHQQQTQCSPSLCLGRRRLAGSSINIMCVHIYIYACIILYFTYILYNNTNNSNNNNNNDDNNNNILLYIICNYIIFI